MSANFLTGLRTAAALALCCLFAPSLLPQTPPAEPLRTIEAKATPSFGIAVPVLVNGAGPFWCTLDTGSNHVFSLHSEAADKFGLKPAETGLSAGVGSAVIADKRLTGATLKIGHLEIPNRTVVIRDSAQGPTGCILGTQLLADFVVEMDYRTPALRLYAPRLYKPRAAAVEIPMTLDEQGNPLVHARLLLRAGETVDAHLMLDTGASVWPVALWKRFTDDNNIVTRGHKVVEPPFQAGGPGGSATLLATRADSFSVGPFSSPQPMVMLFRTPSGSAVVNSWDGPLGAEFTRRFTLTIDYANGHLYLEPNRDFSAPPQPFDASGLLIRGQPDHFVIRKVLAASPGAAAGLVEGDIVTTLDGIASADLTVPAIEAKLYRSAGKCVFRVQRGDKEFDAVVALAPVQW